MRSLRSYLAILVIGAMLPGAILTGALVWRAFANNRATAEGRLLDSARVDGRALERQFDGAIAVLGVLATSRELEQNDLAAFYEEARRVQATQRGWYAVVLQAANEEVLVHTRVAWGTPLPAVQEPGSVRRVIESRTPAVGTLWRAVDVPGAYLFAVRVPVLRQDSIQYVVSALLDTTVLEAVVPQQPSEFGEWTRTILDPNGTIAVRTRGGADFVGTSATPEFMSQLRREPENVSTQVTREGVAVYAAASRSARGWSTIVVVPTALLDTPLVSSAAGVLMGALLLVVCGLVAVVVISRRLTSDIGGIAAVAEAVAGKRPAPRIEPKLIETARLQRSLTTTVGLLEQQAHARELEAQRADAARAEAEAASRTKDQFLAVLGHELRNPLAPALTALELMKVRNASAFVREREILERQIRHMTRLVDDLLDVSRLARGRIELARRRVEVREIVNRAVDMAQPLVAQKRHQLTVSAPAGLVVDADPDRMVQVLSNLLTNAAKYTPDGGHIAVSASGDGDRAVIECEDDGPGVPEGLMPALFDAFAQGPRGIDRREGGLGLGLALARTFTELHGGTLRVSPGANGTGARFVVSLPRVHGAAAEERVSTAPALTTLRPRRVLLVEDNADAREMLRVALTEAGHTVTVAENGAGGIAAAAAEPPQVAILDVGLPDIDGYELARRLRSRLPEVRLIAVTGYGQPGDREAALSAGFTAHCTKPVAIGTLLDFIDERHAPSLALRES